MGETDWIGQKGVIMSLPYLRGSGVFTEREDLQRPNESLAILRRAKASWAARLSESLGAHKTAGRGAKTDSICIMVTSTGVPVSEWRSSRRGAGISGMAVESVLFGCDIMWNRSCVRCETVVGLAGWWWSSTGCGVSI